MEKILAELPKFKKKRGGKDFHCLYEEEHVTDPFRAVHRLSAKHHHQCSTKIAWEELLGGLSVTHLHNLHHWWSTQLSWYPWLQKNDIIGLF